MSYIVFVWVQVYHWLPINVVACELVSITLRFCVHCRTPFYVAPPFPVTPTLMATACSVELAGWAFCLIDQVLTAIDFVAHSLLLCSHPRKIVDLLQLHDGYWIVHRSQSTAVLWCCRTLVTSSSHCCLCMHHVDNNYRLCFYKSSLIVKSL